LQGRDVTDVLETEMDAIVRRLERKLRDGWVKMLRGVKDDNLVATIARKVNVQDLGTLVDGLEDAVRHFTSDVTAGYVHAAQRAARRIDDAVRRTFRLDLADPDAVRWMRETAEKIARPLVEEQQAVARRVVQLGRARNLTTRQIAAEVQSSIGLSPAQVDQVERYRALLMRGDYRTALSYKLSDGRHDVAVRRAMEEGRLLGADRVDQMVARYRDNWKRHRAVTVASDIANEASHAGVTEAFAQAVEGDFLDEDDIIKRWISRADAKCRPSHRAAHGQSRRIWESYVVGGHRARYPGDSRLPARERAGCRCLSVVTITPDAVDVDRFRGPRQVLRSYPVHADERLTFRRAS
jgi:hypothetical protein